MGKKKKNDWSGSVFIRHTPKAKIFKKKPKRITELFGKKLIAIDFGNSKNKNPKKLKRKTHERTALETLQACRKKGAIVCAEYSCSEGETKKRTTKMLIGKIEKKTTIRDKKILGKTINRTMQLEHCLKANLGAIDPIPVGSPAYMLLTAIRPRGGTIAKYDRRSSKLVKAIFSKKKLPREVGSLIPAQLEVICYEYLKQNKKLDALLLPIGRTLQGVDIWGIDKNRNKVFAQVTHNKDAGDIEKKINDLKKYGERLFFFGPKEQLKKYKSNENYKAIDFVSIETVFTKSKESMIDAMLPKNYLETKRI